MRKFLYRLIILIIMFVMICTMLNVTTLFVNASEPGESEDVFDTTLAKKITPENYGEYAEYNVDLNDDGDIRK